MGQSLNGRKGTTTLVLALEIPLPPLDPIHRFPTGMLSIVHIDPLAGRRPGPTPKSWFARHVHALGCLLLGCFAASLGAEESVRGLPFTRIYSYEEIADITGPGHLGFDGHGRLTIAQNGAYLALNDTAWVNLVERNADAPRFLETARDSDGTTYFGGVADWGIFESSATGKLTPVSKRPLDCPKWALETHFNEVVCTPRGVYFGGLNGVVFWNRQTGTHRFFAVQRVTRLLSYRGDVFVSSLAVGMKRLDTENGTLAKTVFPSQVVDNAVELSDGTLLVSTFARQLQVYDQEGNVRDWTQALGNLPSRILRLKRLADGYVAVSASGLGVFVMTEQGQIVSSLTLPGYQRTTDLASYEPGVLWAATESGIAKILYGSPVEVFGQTLGLPVSWPQFVRWRDRLVIASAGRLYEPIDAPATESTRFRLVPDQPSAGSWAIASTPHQLLAGNGTGVYARGEGEKDFKQVIADIDVARLALVEPTLCFAIGLREIAALRWENGRWRECAPRIKGAGYPSHVHLAKRSVWLELDSNRAGRLTLRDGKIDLRVFDSFPWKEPRWINVSVLGDTVMLTGGDKGRLFFDEQTETLGPAPKLEALLARSPYWIIRLREGADGTFWASHEHGLFTYTEKEGFNATRFDLVYERTPLVQILPNGETWAATGDTLMRVEARAAPVLVNRFEPHLVSMRDKRNNLELRPQETTPGFLPRLKYAQNNLEFQFFAGSYASRRPASYEIRLDDEHWTQLGGTSLFSVSDWPEGVHSVDVRLIDGHGRAGKPVNFKLMILPPWHRTWYAFAAYALLAVLLIVLLLRLSVRRARLRNRELTQLVEMRTTELRRAMEKLNEETRNSATLNERQRLAGEIHDSLQQGLTGLTLQIDATLKLPELSPEAKSRLTLARSLVGYSRHEVQNAVSGMDSPLLEHADLAAALRKLTEFIGTATARVQVNTRGMAVALPAAVQHNLLRIAQEAVTNAVRHGAADTIVITLDYGAETMSLSIQDNGRGFDPEAIDGSGHFGLRSLRSRSAKIDAQLKIQSAPGHGTIITIIVPQPNAVPVDASRQP